jgi:hypothetical protein
MLKGPRTAWHKSRALSALQVYFDQPYKEPLPNYVRKALTDLSRIALQDGATPIDTALRFYRLQAEIAKEAGQSLESIGFFGVMGRMWALRSKQNFYQENHKALIEIGSAEMGKDNSK